MTQEELDALLEDGNVDINEVDEIIENDDKDEIKDDKKEEGIYPPPADEDHKVVAQLDEVTKESEIKASEVLEIFTSLSEEMEHMYNICEDIIKFLKHQKDIFEKLHSKFPEIKTFKEELENINAKIKDIEKVLEKKDEIEMKSMSIYEIMQYQDIHRQKIERVINIMRALIKYMNKLFEGKVEDEERTQSAHYIPGDNKEAVSDEEIEELLQQFGA